MHVMCWVSQRQGKILTVFVLFKAALHIICMLVRCSHHVGEGLGGGLPLPAREASLVLEHLVHEFSVSSVCLG